MWELLPEDYILHIYGTGTYKEYVEKVVRENVNINYHGFKSRDNILCAISQSTAVIIASEWYETFGMAIPESFQLSIPVIATNLGNPKSMIERSGGGMTYEINDFNSFDKALKLLIINRNVYSLNSFLYYKNELCVEKNYERLVDIYDKSKVV